MASYIIDGDPYMGGPNKAWLCVIHLIGDDDISLTR
jgi:hypothetical protein